MGTQGYTDLHPWRSEGHIMSSLSTVGWLPRPNGPTFHQRLPGPHEELCGRLGPPPPQQPPVSTPLRILLLRSKRKEPRESRWRHVCLSEETGQVYRRDSLKAGFPGREFQTHPAAPISTEKKPLPIAGNSSLPLRRCDAASKGARALSSQGHGEAG